MFQFVLGEGIDNWEKCSLLVILKECFSCFRVSFEFIIFILGDMFL